MSNILGPNETTEEPMIRADTSAIIETLSVMSTSKRNCSSSFSILWIVLVRSLGMARSMCSYIMMLLFLPLRYCLGLTLCLAICVATGLIDAKTSISGSRLCAMASIIDSPLAIVTISFGMMTPYSCMRPRSASRTPSKRFS